AWTAAALMIGVGLVAFITVFAASTKTSLAGSIRRNYRGDYVVDSGDYTGTSGMSPALAAELRQSPTVAAITANRVATAKVGT
ncbi:hypothetical protein RA269_28660, partial [Pseudomonas syringae pv. tagetis]|uniref:hypothetical protein n=1 Tax=Pseudomonas syringae group genomosp. 7 TaxID=251699 RepID=UPI00376FE02E